MKKLSFYYAVILAFAFTSSGCNNHCGKAHLKLDPKVRELSSFSLGQMYIYSNLELKDTFYVSAIKDTIRNSFRGDECESGTKEIIQVSLLNISDTTKNFAFQFEYYWMNFEVLKYRGIYVPGSSENSSKVEILESFKMNGRDYANVIHFTCIEENKCEDVKEFYYSKLFGVLAYVTEDGKRCQLE